MLLSTVGLLLQLLAPQTRDDAGVLRGARSAQQRFESTRRARLPLEWSGGGGRCDARIGRYCYWYDTTDSKPIPESRAITDARERLIAQLDSAARLSPRDAWIAGQRVRYLLEAGRVDGALVAAHECAADRWWCAALEGLTLHVGERYQASDSAFATALAAMPEPQRCDWLDVRDLVPLKAERSLARADCAERGRLGDRLVTLAQPLWMIPGHDWRTEIFSRLTMALLLERAANPQMSWGDDSRELLMRYGWSEWFTRTEPSGPYASAVVTGHDREPSYNVFPDVQSARAPRLTADAWQLRSPLARSRYAPRGVKRLGALRHQLAQFVRGDTMLVAVRFAATDTALEHDTITAMLTAMVGDSLLRTALSPAGGVAALPRDTAIVSVEVLGARSRHAERARYTIDPPTRAGGVSLSALLLFSPTTDSAADIGVVLASALADSRVSAREAIGVYWEIDDAPREPVAVSLEVEPVRVSKRRRLATHLRLAPELAPVRLHWQAVVTERRGQHVVLRLPENARGAYRITVTVQQRTARPLSSSRLIDVVP